jgi:hypothetical protein
MGIALGDCGESGGLKKGLSIGGDILLPGLKTKEGSGGTGGIPPLFSTPSPKPCSCASTVDRERLPVAREKDEGAEAEVGRAGNTKGGFGGGLAALSEGDSEGAAPDKASSTSERGSGRSVPLSTMLGGIKLETEAVAILMVVSEPRQRTRSTGLTMTLGGQQRRLGLTDDDVRAKPKGVETRAQCACKMRVLPVAKVISS